jgi:hypothetical protein
MNSTDMLIIILIPLCLFFLAIIGTIYFGWNLFLGPYLKLRPFSLAQALCISTCLTIAAGLLLEFLETFR